MTRASQPNWDDLAGLMLALAEESPTPLGAEEAEAIAEAEAEIGRGEGVPAETIEAFWRAHGL